MSARACVVFKLGGSLLYSAELPGWLKMLADQRSVDVVIVPGGGRFADQVRLAQREQGFADDVAHREAILAMHETAKVFCTLEPRLTPVRELNLGCEREAAACAVWLPSPETLSDQASWDVTSDSIALHAASALNAPRIALVKSVSLDGSQNWQKLADDGVVDRAFPQFAERYAGEITLFHKADVVRARAWLERPE